MFKKILIGLVVVIAVFLVVVAMQPSDFKIARSATMNAPAADVFAQVNDFHKWEAWSPWLELDPQAKTTYEGPESGQGAIFKWTGNSNVGEGKMTITESKPNERIAIQLDFYKPMEGTSMAEFTFKPDGDKTAVTWSMAGHNNFIAKALCLFMNMDKMIGDNFDKGLAKIKQTVEPKEAPKL